MDIKDKYNVEETVLGYGGFGVVYAGTRKSDGQKVAVKMVKKKYLSATMIEDDIPLEVKLLQAVQNVPGIITFYDYFATSNAYYIVMEQMEGTDLFQFISARGPLEENIAVNIFKQVIDALIECQNHNVHHGDVKDDNILINQVGQEVMIKLIDMGSGTWYSANTVMTENSGARVYSPPEWIVSEEYYQEAFTVWNLGILLYYILCGNLPFEEDVEIIYGELMWPIPISFNAKDLVIKCLNKCQKSRLTLQQVVNHPWLVPIQTH